MYTLNAKRSMNIWENWLQYIWGINEELYLPNVIYITSNMFLTDTADCT